jgi:hypothetical protein
MLHATDKSIWHIIFPPELPATNVKFRFKDITADEMVDLDTTTLKVTPVPIEIPIQELTWTVGNPCPIAVSGYPDMARQHSDSTAATN